MPPSVTSRRHINLVAGAAIYDHAPDIRAIFERLVDGLLERDEVAASPAAIGGDH